MLTKKTEGDIMELSERKLKILQAIVGDYIRYAEPVGSRTLSKKYDLGISAATIRNEMADLEEMGLLTHPHTSAGRVPSDKAYRLYVNSLMEKYELPDADKFAIESRITSNITELDRTLQRASQLLSELTNLTAFAMTPAQDSNRLKYVNILPVDEKIVVLMIVAESGKITNTAVRLKTGYDPQQLEILSKVMTHNYKGELLSSILTANVIEDLQKDVASIALMARDIVPSFMKTLENMLDVELYVEGLDKIFYIPEYSDLNRAKMFMDMVSKKDELERVLLNRDSGVMITIGGEHSDENMKDCSLITASYHVDGKFVGKIGVVGPTRMRYGEVTSIIEYLTENLDNAFKLTEGEHK